MQISAQGNLQFNRALNETYFFETFNSVSNSEMLNAFTVPSGKVWKLTSISSGQKLTAYPFPYDVGGLFVYRENGQPNYTFIKVSNDANYNTTDIVWIPEGTYDLSCRGANITSTDYLLHFSGIEFNITPP